MQLIYKIDEFPEAPRVHPEKWTAIIPAAGRGSRLSSAGPKILHPILDKPILTWLMDLLKPLCLDILIVGSPDGAPLIRPHLKPLRERGHLVVQAKPTGMGDAIALCEEQVKTPYTLVIWGDQITTRPRTLAACMSLQESVASAQAVIPTMERLEPYIHFRRDLKDRILEVFQAREDEVRVRRGESDCGVFCFRTDSLFRVLRKTRGSETYRGAKTGENNFLSLLPLFHNEQGWLLSVRLNDVDETVGINTPDDAERVSRILKKRADERAR
jgi:bifunctional UDP-N-acetylglucosamine pyrophosphorylase/glucosamine-1-phosphate N-acetyltransferase